MKPLVILVAGGTASGKSTVVKEVLDKSGLDDVIIIRHDDYYKKSDLPLLEREKINYDHPDSLDNELLISDLKKLLNNEIIKKPIYDFTNHNRSNETEVINPKKVIIVEGILILEDSKIREFGDILVFVEADDDIRFIRRMQRDLVERGRTLESIVSQYTKTVKPMHHKFVSPSKRFADIIILNDTKHNVAVDLIVSKIKHLLGNK